jgi:DNA-directed RNA polymerase II subunit RPB1
LGVPRFEELINASKKIKTPSSTVFPTTDLRPEKAWKIKTQIQKTIVKDLISKHSYDNTITPQLQEYLDCPDNTRWNTKTQPTHILTCHFDRKKMIQSDITLEDIVGAVRKIGKAVIVAYYENLLNDVQLFVRLKDDTKFFKYVKMIMDTTIKGSKYIEKVNIRSEGERFIVETEGIDLTHLQTLQSIDTSRTQCNDIFAIRKVFGIEAARAALLKEMYQVLAAYGIYVNHRHLMVITDWMTWGGNINALTRHGVKKMMDDSTPLKRATFEQPVEIFHHAAVKGLKDTLSGVSEQLLIGNAPKIGSYYNDVIVDQEYQKMWDNDNWQPPAEMVEDDLFGDWSGTSAPTSEWESHQTFATVEETNETKSNTWQKQTNSAWHQLQQPPIPAWENVQQGWLVNQAPAAWQTNQAPKSPDYCQKSPDYWTKSPDYGPRESPPSQKLYNPTNSGTYIPQSPTYGPRESPPSQKLYNPTNSGTYIPQSPTYGPRESPPYKKQKVYSPTSPAYESNKKLYSPTNNTYSPNSPTSPAYESNKKLYSPTNNTYSPNSPTSPAYESNKKLYSPTNNTYSPSSPQKKKQKLYSPTNNNNK